MSQKNTNKKYIIEAGDLIKFKYQIKPYNDEAVKFDEIIELVVGKNTFINGFDEKLIGLSSENKKIEIENFLISNSDSHFSNQLVHLGLKIIEHNKNEIETNYVENKNDNEMENIENKELSSKIEKLEEEKKLLLNKIEKLENELNKNLIDFKTKQEEIIQKAQIEVSKIRDEIKVKAKEEINENKKYVLQKFIEDLSTPLNNLHISVEFGSNQQNEIISGYVKGFQLLVNQIFSSLENNGITIIEPKIGEEFNPEYHHAQELVYSDEFQQNQITKITSRGYKLNDRVIKPAVVIVSK